MKKLIGSKRFYKMVLAICIPIVIQNGFTNLASLLDNIMIGQLGTLSMSGVSITNQLLQVFNVTIFGAMSGPGIFMAQFYGKKNKEGVENCFRIKLIIGIIIALLAIFLFYTFGQQLISLYLNDNPTDSLKTLNYGMNYLKIMLVGLIPFVITQVYSSSLRETGNTVLPMIASVVAVIVNFCINYILIFGHFGFPEMGIQGAAVGTLTARMLELLIIVVYIWKIDTKVRLFDINLFRTIFSPENRKIWGAFFKVAFPIMCSGMIWAISVPMQTAILGHLSADAIAANSVSSTFFQYLKVIVIAISSASAVVIGKDIGEGDIERVKSDGRTLSVIDVLIGIVLASLLFVLRGPLLSMYKLTDTAAVLANHFIMIMSVVMVGMSYQMPVSVGVIQGGGDTRFSMYMNMISTWGIVMPLSFLAAFVWKLPVELVVVAVQSDQLFKGIPVFLRFRSYKWIHKLT